MNKASRSECHRCLVFYKMHSFWKKHIKTIKIRSKYLWIHIKRRKLRKYDSITIINTHSGKNSNSDKNDNGAK